MDNYTIGGRHADKTELLTEELASLKAAIAETEHDISWRATRYAMDGDRTNHDAMIEALTAIRSIIRGNNEPIPCLCNWPIPEPHPHIWGVNSDNTTKTCVFPRCGVTTDV